MKITKEYLNKIIKEEIDKQTLGYKLGQAQLEQVAKKLRQSYSFLKFIKNDLLSAPEKVTQIEKKMFDIHLKPTIDSIYSLGEQIDVILDNFDMKSYQEFWKIYNDRWEKFIPAFKTFYIECKENGVLPSKPYLKMLEKIVSQEVKHLQDLMNLLDKYNEQ